MKDKTDGNLSFLDSYLNKLERAEKSELDEQEQERFELQEQATAFIGGFLSDIEALGSLVEYDTIEEQCSDWLKNEPKEGQALELYFDTLHDVYNLLNNINNPNNYIHYVKPTTWGYLIKVER